MHAEALIDRFRGGFPPGFTAITHEGDADADIGIDFGMAILAAGQALQEQHPKESAWVLLRGKASVSCEGHVVDVERGSLFALRLALGGVLRLELPHAPAVRIVAATLSARSARSVEEAMLPLFP